MKRSVEEADITTESSSSSAHKRPRVLQDGPSIGAPLPVGLAVDDIRSLLVSVGVDPSHAAELAARMIGQKVDTFDALLELDEAQMFFLGATIGDQAKLRLLRHRVSPRGRVAGPGGGPDTSDSHSRSLSPPRQSQGSSSLMDIAPQSFVNGPVSTLLGVTPMGVLGRGAYGVVMRGVWGDAATPVAMKAATQNAPQDARDGLIVEASMLSSLRHPNVLQMYGVAQHQGELYLVTELADGNLLSLLRQLSLPLSVRVRACRDVASGMQYLASNNIVHRDLACRNVLFQGNAPVVKISDFGLSRIRWREAVTESVDSRMTIRWTPPEAYERNNWTEKSDVWSMGVLIWEVMTNGMRPWDGLDTAQVKAAILSGARLLQPPGCPDPLYALMLRSWDLDPSRRPSFGQIGRFLNEMLMRVLENPISPNFDGVVLSQQSDSASREEESWGAGQEEKEVCGYHINAKDTIIFVEQPVWDTFLVQNQCVCLVGKMVGRSLWEYVSGAATQHLYRLLLGKIRETGRPVTFPFRCDSPRERRFLEMQVLPMPCRCVQFRSVTRKVEPRMSVQMLLDADAPRDESKPPVPMCSLCKKVRAGSKGAPWMEVEDALASGLLSVSGVLPPLDHDCCENCYRRVSAKIPLS